MEPDTTANPLLIIENLATSYNHHQILQDVCLTIWPNQVVAIVGPNGAGKTTVLQAVGGLIKPVSGRIIFRGEDIAGLPIWEIVQRGIVYVPEGMKIFGQMSILENLEIGGYLNRPMIPERLEYVFGLFPELKIKYKVRAGVLSGGQQRMVTLGRSLMADTSLLLLDDPFLGLSPKYVQIFCNTFRILRQSGLTLFISGQHVPRILNVADLAFLIEGGNITLTGTGKDLLRNHHLNVTLFG
jgi:branched-chain amino acid transport system ATP-binding protein